MSLPGNNLRDNKSMEPSKIPTLDLLSKDVDYLVGRIMVLEAENSVLRAMEAGRNLRATYDVDVRVYGFTMKEILVILNRYQAIDKAMTDFKMP